MTNPVKEVKEQPRSTGQNSRELIFQKSLQLFTERGYDGTSIDDIRQATGFKSKASFYTHFKSKEELSNALLTKILEDESRIITEIFQTAPAEPLAQFLAVSRAFIRWGLTNPKEYAFCFLRTQQEMLIRGSYSDQAEQANEAIIYLIDRMRARYPVRKISSEAMTSMIVGLISKAVIDQAAFAKLNLEEKLNQIVEMCIGILMSERVRY